MDLSFVQEDVFTPTCKICDCLLNEWKMKIKNALSAVAAVWAIISASPAEAGPDGGSSLGTIIVYRPWSLLSSGMEFNVNHGPDLLVRNGTYYRIEVSAGR